MFYFIQPFISFNPSPSILLFIKISYNFLFTSFTYSFLSSTHTKKGQMLYLFDYISLLLDFVGILKLFLPLPLSPPPNQWFFLLLFFLCWIFILANICWLMHLGVLIPNHRFFLYIILILFGFELILEGVHFIHFDMAYKGIKRFHYVLTTKWKVGTICIFPIVELDINQFYSLGKTLQRTINK